MSCRRISRSLLVAMLLMILSLGEVAFSEQYPSYINGDDMMIYNQWSNKWYEDDRAWYYWKSKDYTDSVYLYEKKHPRGMTLAGGGCGIFALAHIAQALGLEPVGNEELPYSFAELYKYTYAGDLHDTRIMNPYMATVDGLKPPAMTFRGSQTFSAK